MKTVEQYNISKQFLTLFMDNQKRIFSYILSLVPHRVDAEDIMQQAVLEMWGKFDQYKPDTNFSAWAITFTRFIILKHRNKQQKMQILSPETFDLISGHNECVCERTQHRTQALQNCIEKLGLQETQLLRLRYEEGCQVGKIANQVGQTVNVIYKSLAKIHTHLQLCIRRTLAERGVL